MKSQLLIFLVVANSIITSEACGPGRTGGRRQKLRKYPPLIQRQYIPNVSENTLGASGRPEGAIKRRDKRFKELVQNWNPDIEFRDDERTGADRMMSQRLKEKLSTLAISVMNQWPNVKLRVIEGWDEDNKHSVNSLHYEGRAVDITTSDRDKTKYGMLARLAVEAGFDWVHYESRSHVHCSVKSEKADTIRNNGCFDSSSLVETPFGQVEMSQLQTNDLVLTMNPRSGQLQFSPIIMWLDRDELGQELFVELATKSNRLIRLTSSHLIYVTDEPYDLTQLNVPDEPNASSKEGNTYAIGFAAQQAAKLAQTGNGDNNQNNYFYYETQERPSSLAAQKMAADEEGVEANQVTIVPNKTTPYSNQSPNDAAKLKYGQLVSPPPSILDDFATTTYARNLIVGQYLLVSSREHLNSPQTNPTVETSMPAQVVNNDARLRYDLEDSTEYALPKPNGRLLFQKPSELVEISEPQNGVNSYDDNVLGDDDIDDDDDEEEDDDEDEVTRASVQSAIEFDQIVSVNYVNRKGIYAPLTREGNIVVNSVVASCYAVISDQELAHLSFAPVRWFSYLNEWLFGLESRSPLSHRTIGAIRRNSNNISRNEQDYNSQNLDTQPATNPVHRYTSSILAPLFEKAALGLSSSQKMTVSSREIHWYPSMLYKIAKFILPSGYLY